MELQKHIESLIKENIKPNNHINTSKMSSKEKSQLIENLENEIKRLNIRLNVTEDTYKRYVSGIISQKQKFEQASIITLPSGRQILATELTSEQLELIENTLQVPKKI